MIWIQCCLSLSQSLTLYLGRNSTYKILLYFWSSTLKNVLFIFRERGREGERGGEKHRCVRNIGCLLHTLARDLACNPGMGPGWNLTGDLSGLRTALTPLSHTSQGWSSTFKRVGFTVLKTMDIKDQWSWLHVLWLQISRKLFVVCGVLFGCLFSALESWAFLCLFT